MDELEKIGEELLTCSDDRSLQILERIWICGLTSEPKAKRTLRKKLTKWLKVNGIRVCDIETSLLNFIVQPNRYYVDDLVSFVVHYIPEGIYLMKSSPKLCQLIETFCTSILDDFSFRGSDSVVVDKMKLLVQIYMRDGPFCNQKSKDISIECAKKALEVGSSVDTKVSGAIIIAQTYLANKTINEALHSIRRLMDTMTSASSICALAFAASSQFLSSSSDFTDMMTSIQLIPMSVWKNRTFPDAMSRLLFTMCQSELSSKLEILYPLQMGCNFHIRLPFQNLINSVSDTFWNEVDDRIEVEDFNIVNAYAHIMRLHGKFRCIGCNWLSEQVNCYTEAHNVENILSCQVCTIVSGSLMDLCDRASAKQLASMFTALASRKEKESSESVLKPIIDFYFECKDDHCRTLVTQLILPDVLAVAPVQFCKFICSYRAKECEDEQYAQFITIALASVRDVKMSEFETTFIPVHYLNQILVSWTSSKALQADAFKLLCSSSSSTPNMQIVHMILNFLTNSAHLFDAYMRNSVLISLEKFFKRCRSLAVKGKCKDLYEYLIRKMFDFLLKIGLETVSTYTQRNFSLNLLKLLLNPLHYPSAQFMNEALNKHLQRIVCTETHDDNQKIAFDIVKQIPDCFSQEEKKLRICELKEQLNTCQCPRILETTCDALVFLTDNSNNNASELIEELSAMIRMYVNEGRMADEQPQQQEQNKWDTIRFCSNPQLLSQLLSVRRLLAIDTVFVSEWTASALVSDCVYLWKLALAVVATDSPEGENFLIPMDLSVSPVSDTFTNQKVLVFSWRLVKEVTAILSILFIKPSSPALNLDQLSTVWESFITGMLGTRHHGAFEQTHTNLIPICERVWRSVGMRGWAERTLADVMAQFGVVSGDNHLLRLQTTTRRSGGLPLLIHAIVSTNSRLLSQTVLQLITHVLAANAIDPSLQVHCLNVIRVLFRSQISSVSERELSHLAALVFPHTLNRLSSVHVAWNVRNAASLLYKCLLMHFFGTDRSHAFQPSSRNKLELNRLKALHPELLKFLCDRWQHETDEAICFSLLLFTIHIEFDRWSISDTQTEQIILQFIFRCVNDFGCVRMHRMCAHVLRSITNSSGSEAAFEKVFEQYCKCKNARVRVSLCSLLLSLNRVRSGFTIDSQFWLRLPEPISAFDALLRLCAAIRFSPDSTTIAQQQQQIIELKRLRNFSNGQLSHFIVLLVNLELKHVQNSIWTQIFSEVEPLLIHILTTIEHLLGIEDDDDDDDAEMSFSSKISVQLHAYAGFDHNKFKEKLSKSICDEPNLILIRLHQTLLLHSESKTTTTMISLSTKALRRATFQQRNNHHHHAILATEALLVTFGGDDGIKNVLSELKLMLFNAHDDHRLSSLILAIHALHMNRNALFTFEQYNDDVHSFALMLTTLFRTYVEDDCRQGFEREKYACQSILTEAFGTHIFHQLIRNPMVKRKCLVDLFWMLVVHHEDDEDCSNVHKNDVFHSEEEGGDMNFTAYLFASQLLDLFEQMEVKKFTERKITSKGTRTLRLLERVAILCGDEEEEKKSEK